MAETVERNKKKFLEMALEEKRKHYQCKTKYNTLGNVETWAETITKISPPERVTAADLKQLAGENFGPFVVNKALNTKVSMWEGDITSLEIDAIVNAANEKLLGGGGVDGAIHRAAGPELKSECATLNGCPTGDTKITGGYKLPAKYVIHTVGPRGTNPSQLTNAYNNSLGLLLDHGLRTVAFPCISTGIYGYPQEDAARVALKTTRAFLDKHGSSVDRIIFCLFLEKDIEIYRRLMQVVFPVE